MQAWINWEGCGRNGIRRKNAGGDGGRVTDSPDGVAFSWIVSVCQCVYLCYLPHAPQNPEDVMYHPMHAPHEPVNVSTGTGSPG